MHKLDGWSSYYETVALASYLSYCCGWLGLPCLCCTDKWQWQYSFHFKTSIITGFITINYVSPLLCRVIRHNWITTWSHFRLLTLLCGLANRLDKSGWIALVEEMKWGAEGMEESKSWIGSFDWIYRDLSLWVLNFLSSHHSRFICKGEIKLTTRVENEMQHAQTRNQTHWELQKLKLKQPTLIHIHIPTRSKSNMSIEPRKSKRYLIFVNFTTCVFQWKLASIAYLNVQ